MEERKCSRCRKSMSDYNPSHICWACQEKLAEERWRAIESPYVYVSDIAQIIDLSEEQVKRLHRQGRLPSPLALTRELKWDKELFLSWIRSQHKVPPALGRQMEAFIKAHGGLHPDERTGVYKLGKKESIQVSVYSKDKDGEIVSEKVIVSSIIPGHYEET